MKLSVETKMAAAVAAGVMAITAGAIAQTQSSGQPPNEYAPTTNPSVNTHMGQRGYNDSSSANQNGQSFADQSAPSNRLKKSRMHSTRTYSKHRTQATQQKQKTQTSGSASTPGY